MINFDKYIDLLEKYLDKQTKYFEKRLSDLFIEFIDELLKEIGKLFRKFERDGVLSQSEMRKYKRTQTFKRALQMQIDALSLKKREQLERHLNDSYEYSFDWMSWAIEKEILTKQSTIGRDEIRKRALTNDISKIKLSDTLEKHRKQVISDINKAVDKGIRDGHTYKQMSYALSKTLENDYNKAIRTARTETHRVRERGVLDVAQNAHKNGVQMSKRWRSNRDERVRSQHRQLDKQTVPVDELFAYGMFKAPCPSAFGVPELDINCRCGLSYTVVAIKAQTNADLARRTFEEYRKMKDNV